MTFLGGFVIGFVWSFFKLEPSVYREALALSNLVFGSVGFLIVGLLNRMGRWRHLLQVAFLSWIGSLINLAFGMNLAHWALGLIFILIIMGIGGGVAALALPAKPSGPGSE